MRDSKYILLLIAVVLIIPPVLTILSVIFFSKNNDHTEKCENKGGVYIYSIGKCLNKNAIIDME